MIKILSVIGTRPEAIKMAPIIKAFENRHDLINSKVIVTAQHRKMVDQVLNLFKINPAYDLNVMTNNQTLTQVASTVLARLEPILHQECPDWLLVQGDTTTTMAAAMAAFYFRVRVGHIEAGLRTYNKWQPFPEEINRTVASLLTSLHFAPTEGARQNLLKEGVNKNTVFVTGNPVIDALKWAANLPLDKELIEKVLPENPETRVVLLTAHRRENFGQGIVNICQAIKQICLRYGNVIRIVYPVHPNPSVEAPVKQLLGDVPQVILLPPLMYQSLVQVMARSYLVLTDSGGIQEEAPGLGKPVLVLRDVTERPEAVLAGTVRLVGTNPSRIIEAFVELWEKESTYQQMAKAINPYGDGYAAERITSILVNEPVTEFSVQG